MRIFPIPAAMWKPLSREALNIPVRARYAGVAAGMEMPPAPARKKARDPKRSPQ